MNSPRSWRACLLASLLTTPLVAVSPAQGRAALDRPHRALLIGVGDYPDGVAKLRGPRKDVTELRALLLERFGFRADEIVTLLDGEATHRKVVETFYAHLIEDCPKGAEVVFYFAGHGSRIPDRSGAARREEQDLDSSLVLWDSRAEGAVGSRDFSDDELGSLLLAVAKRTDRITVLIDACHAGDAVRGEGRLSHAVARSIGSGTEPLDREWVRGFWPAEVKWTDDDGPRVPEDHYVMVTAARATQVAREHVVDETTAEVHGLFTFELLRALTSLRDDDTWDSVHRRVRARVHSESVPQSVQLGGHWLRRPFGAVGAAQIGFGCLVRGAGDVEVEAGWLHGLRPGAQLRGFDSEGRELGMLRVHRSNRLGAWRAVARWVEEPERAGELVRVVPEGLPEGVMPLRVQADRRIARTHSRSSIAPLVSWRSSAEAADYALRDEDGELSLTTVEGVPIAAKVLDRRVGPDERAVLLGSWLREELRWRALRGLVGERGDLAVEAEFVIPSGRLATVGGIAGRPVRAVLDREGPPRIFAPSSADRLATGSERIGWIRVHNRSEHDLHVSVLSLEEQASETARHRSVLALRGSEETCPLVKAGTSVDFEAFFVLDDWPLERAMEDCYLVLAATKRIPARRLANGPDRERGDPATDAQLPDVLRSALQIRGELRSVDTSGYGITGLMLHVVPDER